MTVHIPVLPDEILHWLAPGPNKTIVDGTLGGGGHANLIAEKLLPGGKLIAFDRDPLAVEETSDRLAHDNVDYYTANYADIPEYLNELKIPPVDGLLLDLGLSSDQLADQDRGFSYHASGGLDLRFDQTKGEPAWRLVNRLGEKHLANLIYEFGEEKFSRRVARKICESRHITKITTAQQLAELVRSCVPRARNHSIDPATRTFQALRIAVNDELKWLRIAIKRLPAILKPGGRIAVISFHSLEDRIVKHAFNEDHSLSVLTKKPQTASEEEIIANPRSRSAKLRVAEKLAETP